mmetsp:Transcript_22677/g.64198  ORF Transcript_22677/g.64198 Transcript_22677/m.64198 type:complete len:265 (-) Transcript_22677:536-1330(-)
MSRVVQRHGGLVDALALTDGAAELVDVAHHGQAFSGCEVVGAWDCHDLAADAIADPQRPVRRVGDLLQFPPASVRVKKGPRHVSLVDEALGGLVLAAALLDLLHGDLVAFVAGVDHLPAVGRFLELQLVLVRDDFVMILAQAAGSHMVPQEVRERGDHVLQMANPFLADLVAVQRDHAGEVPRDVKDVFPNLASFLKALVRRVGAEHQEQRKHGHQERVRRVRDGHLLRERRLSGGCEHSVHDGNCRPPCRHAGDWVADLAQHR